MLPPCPFPTLGRVVGEWIEAYLPHGPGDVQGQPIELDDELWSHLLWAYALHPKGSRQAGRRLVLRDVLSRPKGRAKSEFAGMLACAEALGPVRFDGWDATGEPVGKPVTAPLVRCLATEEGQAGNTYDNVLFMLREGRVADEYAVDALATRTFVKEPGGGSVVPCTSGSASKDGGKESFAVADETHLYLTRELRELHRTVARNTGKRRDAEPWMLDTTTAHSPGEGSVAEAAHGAYAHLAPVDCLKRHRVLFDHHEASGPVTDWTDDRQVLAALKDAYGPFAEVMDLRRLLALIRMPEATEAEGRRYFLNQATVTDRVWVEPAMVRAMLDAGQAKTVERGERITLGFDGSRFEDSTALVGCRLADGHLFPIGVWEKPQGPAGKGWEVPAHEVEQAVEHAFDAYKVVRGYFDEAWWNDDVARWHGRFGDAVAAARANSDTWTASACGHARTKLRVGSVSLGRGAGSPIADEAVMVEAVAQHLRNARVRKVRARLDDQADERAHVIEKDRKGSPRKIDAAAACVFALEARDDAIADGALNDGPREFLFAWV